MEAGGKVGIPQAPEGLECKRRTEIDLLALPHRVQIESLPHSLDPRVRLDQISAGCSQPGPQGAVSPPVYTLVPLSVSIPAALPPAHHGIR